MNSEWKEAKRRARRSFWDKFEVLGQIGQGTYGIVFKARSRSRETPREYAIKKFKATPDSEGLSQSACREINLCRELSHENIVNLTEVILDPTEKSISMVFDYAEHDLLQILEFYREQNQPVPEAMTKSIIWQILNGVSYLHANWVLHRDLKPANILIMGDGPEKGVVKIADLGLARLFQAPLQPLVVADRVVVTIWYRSPELLLGAKHYTKAVDLWSVGCIFGEVLNGQSLFKGKEVKPQQNNRNPFQQNQLEKMFEYLGMPQRERWSGLHHLTEYSQLLRFPRSKYTYRLDEVIGEKTTTQGLALLKRLLEYDPTKRIRADEALVHEYFKEEPRPTANALACVGNRSLPRRQVIPVEESLRPMQYGDQHASSSHPLSTQQAQSQLQQHLPPSQQGMVPKSQPMSQPSLSGQPLQVPHTHLARQQALQSASLEAAKLQQQHQLYPQQRQQSSQPVPRHLQSQTMPMMQPQLPPQQQYMQPSVRGPMTMDGASAMLAARAKTKRSKLA